MYFCLYSKYLPPDTRSRRRRSEEKNSDFTFVRVDYEKTEIKVEIEEETELNLEIDIDACVDDFADESDPEYYIPTSKTDAMEKMETEGEEVQESNVLREVGYGNAGLNYVNNIFLLKSIKICINTCIIFLLRNKMVRY